MRACCFKQMEELANSEKDGKERNSPEMERVIELLHDTGLAGIKEEARLG